MNDSPEVVEDVDAWLDEVELPEVTTQICTKQRLLDEHEHVLEEISRVAVEEAQQGARNLANQVRGGSPQMAELRTRLAEIEAEARKATRVFRMRALGRPAYRELTAEHPPPKDSPSDKQAGYHIENFTHALVQACTISPKLTAKQWQRLHENLSPGQWNKLQKAAHDVNRNAPDLPF